jgi:uncharacterized protein YlzI (FlbEa/FlbD family)
VIQLTRSNDRPLLVNSDLIQHAEPSPDPAMSSDALSPATAVTFVNGETVVVRESITEIADLIERALARCARRLTSEASPVAPPVAPPFSAQDAAPISVLHMPSSEAAHAPAGQPNAESTSPPNPPFTRRRRSAW